VSTHAVVGREQHRIDGPMPCFSTVFFSSFNTLIAGSASIAGLRP
jgi:hypothetical protein